MHFITEEELLWIMNSMVFELNRLNEDEEIAPLLCKAL